MNKDLPKMYHNKINKVNDGIQKVYSSIDSNIELEDIKFPNISIEKKINDIFNSNDYVYKADVTIVTDEKVLHKRITIDNEYIPINVIRDIYK